MSPKTTPILPSVSPQKLEVTGPSWASVDVTLAVMARGERLIRCFDPVSASDHSTAGGARMRHKANFAVPRNWYYRSSAKLQHDRDSELCPGAKHGPSPAKLRLEVRRQRRILAHQGDGHAPVGRKRGIVGKQRLGVRLAGNREDVRGRQPLALENLTHRIGAIGRQIKRAVIAARRHEARSGVAGDREP